MANILALHNYSGAKYWRLEQIAKFINKYSGKHQMVVKAPVITPQDQNLLAGCNIIIMQAIGDGRIQQMAEEMREKQGTKIIYELDDLYDQTTPQTNPSHKKTLLIQPMIEDIIKVSDAMTVTNEPLREFYSKMNKNVFTLPNYMDFDGYWDTQLRKNETDTIRLGWAGGLSHKDDLQIVIPVIEKVLKKYPNVKFVYCGYGGMHDPNAPEIEAVYGEDLFRSIPRSRRELISGVPVEYWPKRLATLGLDIAIAPLVSGGDRGHWNECKTPIKWMEYATQQIPTVCSKIKYGEVVEHGRTGYLAETEDEWFDYICELIEDEKLRKTIGVNAYNEVKANHNLADHWKEWLEVYDGVLDGKYKYEGPRITASFNTAPAASPDLFEFDFGIDEIKDERTRKVISDGIRILK